MKLLLKILLVTIIVILIIVGAAYLYLVPMGGTERVVNGKIESLVNEKYNVNVSIGEIKGDVFSGLIIEQLVVLFDNDTTSYQMVNAPRISAEYSIRNIINEQLIFESLTIDSAVIVIKKDSTGRFLLPSFLTSSNASSESDSEGDIPGFEVDQLFLNNVTLLLIDQQDTTRFSDITTSISVLSENNTIAADIRQLSFKGASKLFQLDATEGKVTYANNTLVLKDFILISRGSRIKLDGVIDLKKPFTGNITLNADQLDISRLATLGGPKLSGLIDVTGEFNFVGKSFQGRVDLGGNFLFMDFQNLFVDFNFADNILSIDTLYGIVFDNCSVDGNGFVNFNKPMEKYQINAEVRQFNLNSIRPGTFYSDLNGHVKMTGQSFSNKDLKLDFTVNMFESTFDEYPLQTAQGDFIVTTDSIKFLEPFVVTYHENIFYTWGNVEYSGDMHLDIIARLNNLQRYEGKLFIDQPAGRAYAEAVLSGKTSDPDLSGFFRSDSLWLYGLFADSSYAEMDIKRFLTGKKGYVESFFYNGSAWDIPYQQGYTYITIDSHLVNIDTAGIVNRYSQLSGAGLLNYGIYPNTLQLDTVAIDLTGQSFYNQGMFEMTVDSFGFHFQNSSIGNNGQWLAANGRVNYDETMDLLLSVKNIPILPWMSLYEDTLSIEGSLSSEAYLTGSFSEPIFSMSTSVDSLTYQNLTLGDVQAVMSYERQKLYIDSVLVLSHPGFYRANGSMAMDLAFTTDSLDRFPDQPMDVDITAYDSRFDLISFLLPAVEDMEGEFNAAFKLSGTPYNPRLLGNASLTGAYFKINNKDSIFVPASLKYFDIEEYIYTDSAFITMTDNRILIDSMLVFVLDKKQTPDNIRKGNRPARKAISTLNGVITVKSLENFNYDLVIDIPEHLRPFPFTYSLDAIDGEAYGRLYVRGDTPPVVSGDIVLTDVNYLVNFAEPDEGSPIMMALVGENSWDLDIDIEIPSRYFIKNEDIDAEFAGEINLTRESGLYKFAGYMEILRGKGYLVDKTFRLDPGGMVIFEGDDEFNPTLDLTGYTRVRTAGGLEEESNQSSEVKKLGIRITGTLEEPIITPTEDSDFDSSEDILLAIFANIGSSQSVGQMGKFDQRAYDMLSVQLERIVSRSIGVETFEIEQDASGDFDKTKLTVGDYLWFAPNLYVYGSLSEGRKVEGIGFEYRISRSMILQGFNDENDRYHVNLRWNWEFE